MRSARARQAIKCLNTDLDTADVPDCRDPSPVPGAVIREGRETARAVFEPGRGGQQQAKDDARAGAGHIEGDRHG